MQPGDLAGVATTASYNDLVDLPTLGTAAATASTDYATSAQGALADTAVQPADLATVATTGAYGDLSGTPTLGTAAATVSTDYATAAQGATADTALQPATIGVTVQGYDADLADIAAIADVQGDILVRGASGWERLAKSATSTDVLTAGASQPAWAAATGGSGGPSPWSYATLNLTFV